MCEHGPREPHPSSTTARRNAAAGSGSEDGAAIFGYTARTHAHSRYGVHGESQVTDGAGVIGSTTAADGTGVIATNGSTDSGSGVGLDASSTNGTGVVADAATIEPEASSGHRGRRADITGDRA